VESTRGNEHGKHACPHHHVPSFLYSVSSPLKQHHFFRCRQTARQSVPVCDFGNSWFSSTRTATLDIRGSVAFFPTNRYTHLNNTPMSKHFTPIDISSLPDLVKIAEEVKATKTPRVLKKADETVAILMPVGTATKPKKKRAKTQADYEAFKSAAGGWKGLVDTEQLKRDIYESRKISTRPPIEL
jgi:hypothetical protein